MFARPLTPSEELRIEREKMAKRLPPHLALVQPTKPKPDFYVWRSVSDLVPVEVEG
jgi:hypothetical protein